MVDCRGDILHPPRVSVLIYQGLELIARITDLIDDLEVQSLIAHTAEMLDRDDEVDDWGSLHEIVEEYHNNVRFGGDGQ